MAGSRVLRAIARVAVGIAALILGSFSSGARAQTPMALWLAVEGTARPPVVAFAELTEPVSITLAAGSRLQFYHYATCRVVTVAGGRLEVRPDRYSVDGGTIETETPRSCGGSVSLLQPAGGLVGGGLVARFIPLAPTPPATPVAAPPVAAPLLSTIPSFVLGGQGAGRVALLVLLPEHGEPIQLAVEERRAAWPSSGGSLTTGSTVLLRLRDAAGGMVGELMLEVGRQPDPGSVVLVVD